MAYLQGLARLGGLEQDAHPLLGISLEHLTPLLVGGRGRGRGRGRTRVGGRVRVRAREGEGEDEGEDEGEGEG